MAFVRVWDGRHYAEVEVPSELAEAYAALERQSRLTNRKETRRHQSLDKSLDHGWDVPDPSADTLRILERSETRALLQAALKTLTARQRTILLRYVQENKSFREIGDALGVHRDTVREHYLSAVKKLKKFLQTTPSNASSRGD